MCWKTCCCRCNGGKNEERAGMLKEDPEAGVRNYPESEDYRVLQSLPCDYNPEGCQPVAAAQSTYDDRVAKPQNNQNTCRQRSPETNTTVPPNCRSRGSEESTVLHMENETTINDRPRSKTRVLKKSADETQRSVHEHLLKKDDVNIKVWATNDNEGVGTQNRTTKTHNSSDDKCSNDEDQFRKKAVPRNTVPEKKPSQEIIKGPASSPARKPPTASTPHSKSSAAGVPLDTKVEIIADSVNTMYTGRVAHQEPVERDKMMVDGAVLKKPANRDPHQNVLSEDEFEVEENVWKYIEKFHEKDMKDICGTYVKLSYNDGSGRVQMKRTGSKRINDITESIIELCQQVVNNVGCKRIAYARDFNIESLGNDDIQQMVEKSGCVFLQDTATGEFQIVGPHDRLEVVNNELLRLLGRLEPKSCAPPSVTRADADRETKSGPPPSVTRADADRETKSGQPPSVTRASGPPPSVTRADVAVSGSYKFTTPSGIDVEILCNDLVNERVEAIVNPANGQLRHGSGAARAIAKAAGQKLVDECNDYLRKHKRVECTEVMHTTAGQIKPPILYVIHAVGPRNSDFPKKDDLFTALFDTFFNCLRYANTHLEIRSLSIPPISSGVFGCPRDLVVEAAYKALMKFDRQFGAVRTVSSVHFVDNDPITVGGVIARFKQLHLESGDVRSSTPSHEKDGTAPAVTSTSAQKGEPRGDAVLRSRIESTAPAVTSTAAQKDEPGGDAVVKSRTGSTAPAVTSAAAQKDEPGGDAVVRSRTESTAPAVTSTAAQKDEPGGDAVVKSRTGSTAPAVTSTAAQKDEPRGDAVVRSRTKSTKIKPTAVVVSSDGDDANSASDEKDEMHAVDIRSKTELIMRAPPSHSFPGSGVTPADGVPGRARPPDIFDQGHGSKVKVVEVEVDAPLTEKDIKSHSVDDSYPTEAVANAGTSPVRAIQWDEGDKLEEVDMETDVALPRSDIVRTSVDPRCVASSPRDRSDDLDYDNLKVKVQLPDQIRSTAPRDQLKFATTNSGIGVEIYRQDLLSEKVDVIVCSVDTHLSLSGGAVGAIANAAGAELHDNRGKYLEAHGSLPLTEVTHSGAGKLRPAIKYVIFAAAPPAGMFADDRQLYDAVVRTFLNCMRYANEKLKACSISLPAISSGVYGVPKNVVARAAFEALNQFDKQCQHGGATCSLKTVRFVNIDSESTQAFTSVFSQLLHSVPTVRVQNLPSGGAAGGSPPGSHQKTIDDDKLSFALNCQLAVEIYRGDLLLEKVDAIVCSVNSYLDLNGSAARAIAHSAGSILGQDCQAYFKSVGPLQVTKVTHASSGRLFPHIKHVLLVCGPTPESGKDAQSFRIALVDTFLNCLFYANDVLKISSVAIPAISAGNNSAPKGTVASAAYDALLTFDGKVLRGTRRHLDSVRFVNIDPDTSAAFVHEFNELRSRRTLDDVGDVQQGDSGVPNVPQQSIRVKRTRKLKSADDPTPSDLVLSSRAADDPTPVIVVSSRRQRSTPPCTISVEIHCGDLLKENVDAIVCPVNSSLDLRGGVAKVVARAAGKSVDQGRSDFLASRGSLLVTEATHVTAGDLSPAISYVILAVGPMPMNYPDLSSFRTALVATFYNCLTYANNAMRISSIAVPAISAGVGGAPLNLVAGAALEALVQFEASLQGGATHHQHVRCVRFVNIDQSTSDAFVDAFKNRNSSPFGNPAVTIPLLPDVVSGPDSLPTDSVSRRDRKLKRKVKEPTDIDPSYGPLHTPKSSDDGSKKPKDAKGSGDVEDCVICMDKISDPKKLPCGHEFCTPCIDQYFGVSQPKCPCCSRLFGVMKGSQPPGLMNVRTLRQSLPGYEAYDTIEITYNIPDGIQTSEHPNPGVPYYGITRTGLLPNSADGNEVLGLLKKAWDSRLIFTIGHSITTGADNVVTWNDIHHKTSYSGQYGYPDPSYLSRVKAELAAKGITP